MKQIIIHRDQANDKLETIVFNDILTAKAVVHDLRKNYHDVLLLSELELLELKLTVNHVSETI